MGKWPGKFVIGITGNIGTGKSVVRRMLEHQGALGIDADALSHRAIAKGAPGFAPVVQAFGRWIVGPDGEINRSRLGRVVFSDPEALAQLEAIVHPLVGQAVDWIVSRSGKTVVVIEAIKLLEARLHSACDSIWVVTSTPETQLARLIQKRGMAEADARQRIRAQAPPDRKLSAAHVVIRNDGGFETTWKQVLAAWQQVVPGGEKTAAEPVKTSVLPQGQLSVVRARPRDSETIASLLNRVQIHRTGRPLTGGDIMAEFGDKAFLMLRLDAQPVGVAGWQVENLVARTTNIVIDPALPAEKVVPPMIAEMERASQDLQCEASLVFLSAPLSSDALWRSMGYERRTPQGLGVSAWQEAAAETIRPGEVLYFKQLRVDRVLRPI